MDDDKNTEDKTAEIQNAELLQKLIEAGRLAVKEKPVKKKPEGIFIPADLDGKPLSEIVIEDRK